MAYDEIIDEADWATWVIDGRGLGDKARDKALDLAVLFIHKGDLIWAVDEAFHVGDMGRDYPLFLSPEDRGVRLKEVSKAIA